MIPTEIQDVVTPLDHEGERVKAARDAERTAYGHYRIEYSEHFIELPDLGARMRVIETGSGPPVVLIPGGEGISLYWLPFLPELSEHTLYVMDRPGGGLSDGVDFQSIPLRSAAVSSTGRLFDHFDLDRAPLIGNSMGGLWSLRFALEHPNRVSKLAFLGCPAVYPRTSAPFPMRLGSIPVLSEIVAGKMMRPDSAEDARRTFDFLGHPSETVEGIPDELIEAMYQMAILPHFKQTWIGILQSVLRLRGANPSEAFTYDDLSAIAAPVQLIWGSDDPFGSVEAGRAGAEHFNDAEFHEVGVGHLPWLDEPVRCGKLVQQFLGRSESSP